MTDEKIVTHRTNDPTCWDGMRLLSPSMTAQEMAESWAKASPYASKVYVCKNGERGYAEKVVADDTV